MFVNISTLCYVLLPASVTRGRNLFRLAPFTMLVYAGWADPDITSVHTHVASLFSQFLNLTELRDNAEEG